MNTDVTAQAMAALRERCKALHERMGVDAMLRQNDPVETLFSFAKALIDEREYVVGFTELDRIRAAGQRLADRSGQTFVPDPAKEAAFTRQPEPTQREEGVPVAWPNHCDRTVPGALRYLADYDRPSGGEQAYNSAHLFQLADEIERMAKAPLYARPPAAKPDAVEEAVRAERERCAKIAEDYEPQHEANATIAKKVARNVASAIRARLP